MATCVLPAVSAISLLWSGLLCGQQPAAAPPNAQAPPRLVTTATRAAPAELARLRRPGRVLLVADFEAPSAFERWFEVQGRADGRTRLVDGAGLAHGGRSALQITAPANAGKASGAALSAWLGDEGHDALHLRYWIRYAADYDQGNLNHTGGSLTGVAGTDKWRGMGGAGLRPAGDDHFSTLVDSWRDWQRVAAPGFLHCYTYWMEMQQDRDGHYWGNMLGPEPERRFVPQRGEWTCVELRVAVNQVGKADGELAMWIDGELHLHYQGLRWRSSEAVRLKRAGVLCYVHAAERDNTVWFDDVVVSTGYIGTGGVEVAKPTPAAGQEPGKVGAPPSPLPLPR